MVGKLIQACGFGSPSAILNRPARAQIALAPVGRLVFGSSEAFRLRQLGVRGLPLYPDTSIIPAVTISAPKMLNPAGSEVDWVRILAAGYRGAIWAFYRKRSFLMKKNAHPEKYVHFAALSVFADRLHAAQISPASWAMFSMESWRQISCSPRPAKLLWVFSVKRLESQREWFDDETNRWTGGSSKYAPRHIELLVRWQRMWRELLWRKPTERLSLLAIVDKHFPGNAYEAAVEAARNQASWMQLDVDERIAQGQIEWTA